MKTKKTRLMTKKNYYAGRKILQKKLGLGTGGREENKGVAGEQSRLQKNPIHREQQKKEVCKSDQRGGKKKFTQEKKKNQKKTAKDTAIKETHPKKCD